MQGTSSSSVRSRARGRPTPGRGSGAETARQRMPGGGRASSAQHQPRRCLCRSLQSAMWTATATSSGSPPPGSSWCVLLSRQLSGPGSGQGGALRHLPAPPPLPPRPPPPRHRLPHRHPPLPAATTPSATGSLLPPRRLLILPAHQRMTTRLGRSRPLPLQAAALFLLQKRPARRRR